jgi:hypothetical protein
MNPASIRHAWREAFPHSPPSGSLCRRAASKRWLRTHGLPNSKRYPDSKSEREEVLLRYNAVASEVLGQNMACILFVARFGAESEWPNEQEGPLSGLALRHVMKHEGQDDELQFFATPVTWKSGEFDSLLLAVADDQVDHVLFFNAERRTAFAPYDGGADLFAHSEEEARNLKVRFAGWLSGRADGL